MSLGPVKYTVIRQTATIKQIFEHSSKPNIVRLFLKFQSPNIVKVLSKLL